MSEVTAAYGALTKPLPCPFCGETPRVWPMANYGPEPRPYQVACINTAGCPALCRVNGSGHEQTVKSWNTALTRRSA